MKCSYTQERNLNSGNNKMKMVNHYKSSYKKEPDLENIVDQLCTRLQDIKDLEVVPVKGMPVRAPDQHEAVKRYYAAFPALKKGKESPLQYYLPPPVWCRRTAEGEDIKMQSDLSMLKELNPRSKKSSSGKERRNSYHGQRKGNKKRCNSYSRSFESKENLPEWVTHEGEWDMETQDPVKEFIRAIALDEGYGTCENTVTDDIKEIAAVNMKANAGKVPDWDDSLDFETDWVITEDLKPKVRSPMEEELYAKFEAKFNSSIEALWSRDQANTPDDDYQDLPIDFQDLLSSPSDNQFFDPAAEKCSLISLTESIWSNDGYRAAETPTKSVEVLHDRFKPLNLTDDLFVPRSMTPEVVEPFSLYSYEGIYDAVPAVADVMRSLTAINHDKERSSFTEVLPRRPGETLPVVRPHISAENIERRLANLAADLEPDDLLTSSSTHFKPIRKEEETVDVSAAAVRYADGHTFDIRGDLDPVRFRRSDSGFEYVESEIDSQRYLEYRSMKGIDYSRLNLTDAQLRGNDLEDHEFILRFPLKQIEKSVQTDDFTASNAWSTCEECGRRAGAKKMRPSGIESIWSGEFDQCACTRPAVAGVTVPPAEELSREWEELLSDISAAHAQYLGGVTAAAADRKRRHSAALRCRKPRCSHPHAPFLHCAGTERPLTR